MNNNLYTIDSEYENFKFKIPKKYKVDFDKVESIFDLQVLMEVLFEGLNIVIQEDSAYYKHLKGYLKEL